MTVTVQNTSTMVEYIDVERTVAGVLQKDTITVQPGGKVQLPRGWSPANSWKATPQIKVSGTASPPTPAASAKVTATPAKASTTSKE